MYLLISLTRLDFFFARDFQIPSYLFGVCEVWINISKSVFHWVIYIKDSFIWNPSNAGLMYFTVELFPVFCILTWIVNLWEGHKVYNIFQYYFFLPLHQFLFSEHLILLVLRVRGGYRYIPWETLIGCVPIRVGTWFTECGLHEKQSWQPWENISGYLWEAHFAYSFYRSISPPVIKTDIKGWEFTVYCLFLPG